MASRRYFIYDPYNYAYDPYGHNCYYTAAPYNYPYVQYQQQPAPTGRRKSSRARETKTSFSIPVHGPADSDPEPQREPKAAAPTGARAGLMAPAMSAEEAMVRMQAAARGFLVRKSVRALRKVQREAEQIRVKMVSEAEALVADPKVRVAVGEALMSMLLRLDAVRGAREYRRMVTKQVLALQDAIDALETKPVPAPASMGEEEAEANAPEAMATEMVEESAVQSEKIKNAVHMPIQMDINETIAAGKLEGRTEEEEKEAVPGDANVDVNKAEDYGEGEWEMVTEEIEQAAPVTATSDDQELSRNELVYPLETSSTASTGAACDSVDARKVMEMVAALCQQSAKQCAVIGALAERVDALERTVRQMKNAESTEGK